MVVVCSAWLGTDMSDSESGIAFLIVHANWSLQITRWLPQAFWRAKSPLADVPTKQCPQTFFAMCQLAGPTAMVDYLVSWCFELSHSQRILSGLEIEFNLSPCYSVHYTSLLFSNHNSLSNISHRCQQSTLHISQNTPISLDVATHRPNRHGWLIRHWWFDLSQPQWIISRLETNFNLSPCYSIH